MIAVTENTAASDAYDRELIRALGNAVDRADPVPPQVIANAYQAGDLRDEAHIPQLGAFARQWIADNDTEVLT